MDGWGGHFIPADSNILPYVIQLAIVNADYISWFKPEKICTRNYLVCHCYHLYKHVKYSAWHFFNEHPVSGFKKSTV